MPTTPNMSLDLPVDHDTANDWGRKINNAMTAIDSHNHATGAGAKVNISQIGIDADVSFVDAGGGSHALLNMKAVDFFPVAASAVAALGGAFFISDGTGGLVANELYFRTVVGSTNVQMTNGPTLNVNAFTGGIGGDYGGVGALESYDDGLDAYLFKQQVGAAVRQYAKLNSADIKLFEFKAVGVTPVPSNGITLKAPAGLANTFNLTLPGSLPASTVIAQVDNTGQIILDDTLPVTAPDYKHGIISADWPLLGWSAAGTSAIDTQGRVVVSVATGTWAIHTPLTVGDRVTSVVLNLFKASAGTTTVTLDRVKFGASTTIQSFTTTTAGASALTCTVSAPIALAAGEWLRLGVQMPANTDRLDDAVGFWDRP